MSEICPLVVRHVLVVNHTDAVGIFPSDLFGCLKLNQTSQLITGGLAKEAALGSFQPFRLAQWANHQFTTGHHFSRPRSGEGDRYSEPFIEKMLE